MVPYIYLPDLGQVHVGLDTGQTAILILISGISNTLIRVVMGFIADLQCVDRLVVFSINFVICGLASTFVAYYNSFYLLAVYAAVFGIGIGWYHKLFTLTSSLYTYRLCGPPMEDRMIFRPASIHPVFPTNYNYICAKSTS